MIENDEQFEIAQQGIRNLQKVLLAARQVHTQEEYRLMSEPILLELQRREQEILEYLSQAKAQVS